MFISSRCTYSSQRNMKQANAVTNCFHDTRRRTWIKIQEKKRKMEQKLYFDRDEGDSDDNGNLKIFIERRSNLMHADRVKVTIYSLGKNLI